MDYDRSFGLVAEAEGRGGPEIVAVARISREHASEDRMLTMVVADAWQRRGVGARMVRSAVIVAQGEGVANLVAELDRTTSACGTCSRRRASRSPNEKRPWWRPCRCGSEERGDPLPVHHVPRVARPDLDRQPGRGVRVEALEDACRNPHRVVVRDRCRSPRRPPARGAPAGPCRRSGVGGRPPRGSGRPNPSSWLGRNARSASSYRSPMTASLGGPPSSAERNQALPSRSSSRRRTCSRARYAAPFGLVRVHGTGDDAGPPDGRQLA